MKLIVFKVRQGELSLDELIGSINAFEYVIYLDEKVSPAYGTLLVHLFAQLGTNWRGEIYNVDSRTVQMCLFKRILKRVDEETSVVFKGNLVIWTAALKDIRIDSPSALDWAINWVLSRCKGEESDWPVIFHNLILMTSFNPVTVLKGLYKCLEESPCLPLMDHLIFLIRQKGSLGKLWIKMVMSRGCYKIVPIVFSGLLTLSQDVEYFQTLGQALFHNMKLMQEIWLKVTCNDQNDTSVTNPMEYLNLVAKLIGSDTEAGIKGALQLIRNLCTHHPELSESFLIDLFRLYPFARREILKFSCNFQNESNNFWKQLHEIDEITLKEIDELQILEKIAKKSPELVSNLICNEQEIYSIPENERIKVLIEIKSVLLKRALKSFKGSFCLNSASSVEFDGLDWKELSVGELSALKCEDVSMVPKFVELCELLQVHGALEGCKGGRDNLTAKMIEFLVSEIGENVFGARERTALISKLISNVEDSEVGLIYSCRLFDFDCLFRMINDWTCYEGILKYILERISVYSRDFNDICPKLPQRIEFQILIAKALDRIGEHQRIPLTSELLGVIEGMGERVVSEPQLAKPLMILLNIKGYEWDGFGGIRASIVKFSEISEPNLLKSVIEFGLRHEGIIEGIKEELVKSVIMYYGMIEDEEGSGKKVQIGSKFKHLHLNEKSVNFAVIALLNCVQEKLEFGHKLIKNCPEIFFSNPDKFISRWVSVIDDLLGLTKALISGKSASKLHGVLKSFYELVGKLLVQVCDNGSGDLKLKDLVRVIGGQLNKQIYALLPLQQEKLQTNLKESMNLKKTSKESASVVIGSGGRTVSELIFEMEKFEAILIKNPVWCDRIVRSTARDFKIRIDQL